MVVTCMMTLVTRIGPDNQKGTITGVFRSLGALARACGPIVASIGKSKVYHYFIKLLYQDKYFYFSFLVHW